MKLIQTTVKDAYVLEADRHVDGRGHFQEICKDIDVRQVNWSLSGRGVIRGIHKVPFYKFCTCVSGRLWDVVVDLRPDSPTYLRWHGEWLCPGTSRSLYVPAGCGHAFYAAEDGTSLVYVQGGTYDPAVEESFRYDSRRLGITWPEDDYIVSSKDLAAPEIS